ncbi:Uncharacterized protein PCOAH_00011000 [Plasmodium coatneyi]|uniref:Uncharacterized protein n=1 Tax=Plasmodium coatneyi TaxID=208452 RepID=A0A1B1DVE8_9APIC|nr:Uncharacterized protein PCOAH_00011000 [Plasmodium coatneyi]ANQ06714.1 Uncharacterized protein PCOAH_00011000 [Plasmodium coatneyi]
MEEKALQTHITLLFYLIVLFYLKNFTFSFMDMPRKLYKYIKFYYFFLIVLTIVGFFSRLLVLTRLLLIQQVQKIVNHFFLGNRAPHLRNAKRNGRLRSIQRNNGARAPLGNNSPIGGGNREGGKLEGKEDCSGDISVSSDGGVGSDLAISSDSGVGSDIAVSSDGCVSSDGVGSDDCGSSDGSRSKGARRSRVGRKGLRSFLKFIRIIRIRRRKSPNDGKRHGKGDPPDEADTTTTTSGERIKFHVNAAERREESSSEDCSPSTGSSASEGESISLKSELSSESDSQVSEGRQTNAYTFEQEGKDPYLHNYLTKQNYLRLYTLLTEALFNHKNNLTITGDPSGMGLQRKTRKCAHCKGELNHPQDDRPSGIAGDYCATCIKLERTFPKPILKKSSSFPLSTQDTQRRKETKRIRFNAEVETYYIDKYLTEDSDAYGMRMTGDKRKGMYKLFGEYNVANSDIFSYYNMRNNVNTVFSDFMNLVSDCKDKIVRKF